MQPGPYSYAAVISCGQGARCATHPPPKREGAPAAALSQPGTLVDQNKSAVKNTLNPKRYKLRYKEGPRPGG